MEDGLDSVNEFFLGTALDQYVTNKYEQSRNASQSLVGFLAELVAWGC